MKTPITNLHHVLAFQLEGMYETVKNLQHAIQVAIKGANDSSAKELLRSYSENLFEHRLKLKRAFSYVLNGPYGRKALGVGEAIVHFKEIIELGSPSPMTDILLTTSMKAGIQFMITSYADARYLAMRVELDNVVALLDEILNMEEDFLKRLKSYTARQINDACSLTPAN
jgi:ferritin-like metal-binding protein YciE